MLRNIWVSVRVAISSGARSSIFGRVSQFHNVRMFNRILFNLFQVIVVLVFAPLASGVLSRLKEMVQSKRGPSILQPYRDLWKLFHKDEIVSEESSWISRPTSFLSRQFLSRC
jgi:hypothetical protein